MLCSGLSLAALILHAAGAHGATLPLFHPWNASEWTASDDTVRGGLSRSSLEIIPPGSPGNPFGDEPIARFAGTLDYEALNGSGFASQRTADGWAGADLSAYDRLVLEVLPYADGKTYTVNVKDTVLPPVDGVEQATVSWEHDFSLPARDATAADDFDQVVVRFEDLVPTFRGRVQNDTAPLNLTDIKRFNIMIRSFFGQETQAGDFELRIKSILAADSGIIQRPM